MSVYADGGDIKIGRVWSISNDTTEVDVSTTETAVLAIRLKSSYNRASLKPLSSDFISTTGSSAFIYRFYYQPTISATWTSVNSESIAEFASGTAITSFSSGYNFVQGYIPVSGAKTGQLGNNIESDLYLSRDIDGNSDILLLTIQTLSGNGKFLSSMIFREYY
jgi:hypothetical protein